MPIILMSIQDPPCQLLKNRLKADSDAIKQYFEVIGFNINQFSKSLTLLLKDFIVFIRDKKHLLSDQMRNELIYDTFPLSNQIIIKDSPQFIKQKVALLTSYFNLFKSGLAMMKIDNENIKKKLSQALIISNNKFKHAIPEGEIENKEGSLNYVAVTSEDKLRLNQFEEIRQEIQKIREYKQSLLIRQHELSRKQKQFNEIPSDISLLKQLVEQRKCQYEKIKLMKSA